MTAVSFFPSSPISFFSCTFPCPLVEGACGSYGQAGGLREAGAARCGKGAGKGPAGGPGKARWRTVPEAAAVRDGMRESPRELPRKLAEFEPESR
jgi:hypothetical protein